MVTFMDWVNVFETVTNVFGKLFAEASLGRPLDFIEQATMVVQAIQDIIAKGNYSQAVKSAASKMASAPELQPSVLGGKMRGNLKGISPNDQADIIQDAIMSFMLGFKDMINKDHFAKDEQIDPDDFASYISGNFQPRLTWAKQTYFRKKSSVKNKRIGQTVTDISGGDDNKRPEGSYVDGDEDVASPGIGISRTSWNNAIHIVMSVQDKLKKRIEEIEQGNTRQKTTRLEKRLAQLTTTLTIMRNLPKQMATQMGEAPDDDKVYDRLKSMVNDKDSDIHPDDREILKGWVGKTDGYNDHIHRQFIATALWIAQGMHGDLKPKKAIDEDKGEGKWFYDAALDVEDKPDGEDDDNGGLSPEELAQYDVKEPEQGLWPDVPPEHKPEEFEPKMNRKRKHLRPSTSRSPSLSKGRSGQFGKYRGRKVDTHQPGLFDNM